MDENRIKFYLSIIFLLYSHSLSGQNNRDQVDTLRNYRLREVIVTAIQEDKSGSRSLINQDAIRHIQATDLSGLSQLLPGVLTHNPNLNTPASFTIRSTDYGNTTNALGTAIVVDGLRLNNNANMQQIGLEGSRSLYNSSALSGYDIRTISPASIESVEVIRGIPSARYGDVTSGVVLVKSKAGIQPFGIGLRFTATERIASLGKGLRAGKNGETIYWGLDYAFSEQSPLATEKSFQRFGIQGAYSKDFQTATIRLNLRGYWASDNDKKGKNTVEGEFQKYINRGISFSANGKWELKKSWISAIEYQAGASYGCQKNEASTYYSGTQQVTTYTTRSGEQKGFFLSPNYFSQISVEGKPVHTEISLVGNLKKTIREKLFNHFLLGITAEMERNRGAGIEFDPLHPPIDMLQVRTRSYRSIPLLFRYASFAENTLSIHSGKMKTEIQAGIRITGLTTKALKEKSAVDPRINITQVLITQNDSHPLRRFSVRAGWGLMHKTPVLSYLYPDKSYTDKNCFTYNDTENNQQLAVMHTYITDHTFNPDLQMPVNRKLEAGVNLQFAGITADIVWFNEHLRNGYCTVQQAEPFTYRRYDPLINKGEHPVLTDKGVINNNAILPYTPHTTFATYALPQNGIEQDKQGVEYTVGPIRWKKLFSSLFINGSYIRVKEKNSALTVIHPQIEVNNQPYPFAGIYETTAFASNLQVRKLFSTRFQFITQIPRIGLITSLTLQCVWIDKQRRGMESRYNNPVYMTDENGNRTDGDPMTDTECPKHINPVYYLDTNGEQHPFTPEMSTDKRFSDLVLNVNNPAAFRQDSFGPYFLLNLRVTKKIGRHVSVAFCANNLTKSNPVRYSRSNRQYSLLNPDLYYGAEISIRF